MPYTFVRFAKCSACSDNAQPRVMVLCCVEWRYAVGIENYSEDVLLVVLPREPHLGPELDELTEIVSEGCNRDVIIDFSDVALLTSESICSLMILDKYLSSFGRQLVFCSASAEIKHIFGRTGLAAVFTFADDEHAAVAAVRRSSCVRE